MTSLLTSQPNAQPYAPNSIAWGKQGESDALAQAQKEAWSAAFRSQLQEFDYNITDIEGTIPDTLKGSSLFRNGPSRFERGSGKNMQRVSHYLDGDGYLAKITFNPDGTAHFTSKFIDTAEHAVEADTDTLPFRTTFTNPKTRSPFTHFLNLHLKNPANTHVVPWGDKLLALYEAGSPYRIDPYTLETLGAEDLNGNLTPKPAPLTRIQALKRRTKGQQAMTAHPHIDPIKNRLITWTWGVEIAPGKPKSLTIEIIEYDADWQPIARAHHTMPGAHVNPHDFALTPNYYIFFENAFNLDILPYLLGQKAPAHCLSLEPRPTKVHLIPRPDGNKAHTQPLILNTAQWFSIHQACAWENKDGNIEVYSSGWPATEGGFLTSWEGTAPDFDVIAPTYLWQTRINPDTQSVIHRIAPGMTDRCIAYPCTNSSLETQPSQYLYMAHCNSIGQSSPPTGYLKLNTQTGEIDTWHSHPLNFAEEPIFVPHQMPKSEDHGYLLALMYDHPKQRTALNIFDTANLSHGPICRLWFTHRLSMGLHGSWIANA